MLIGGVAQDDPQSMTDDHDTQARALAGRARPSPGFWLDSLEHKLSALLPDPDAEPHALHRAMRDAMVPGGKRLRPRLLLLVANACAGGQWDPDQVELALRAGCAIELIHGASLVHDDLPSFDNSALRRGRPSIHAAFGEPVAILAGDALLIQAFEILGEAPASQGRQAIEVVALLAKATGSVAGIIGGQALETDASDAAATVDHYHAMKTGALFRFAAEAGARIGGAADPAAWAEVGMWLGRALQLVDDLYDVHGSAIDWGKPIGRDSALGRPNAVRSAGSEGVIAQLHGLLTATADRISALTERGDALHGLALHELIDELRGYVAAMAPRS